MYSLYQIPSEAKIKRDFRALLFGKRIFCPRCGSYRVRRSEKRYKRVLEWLIWDQYFQLQKR